MVSFKRVPNTPNNPPSPNDLIDKHKTYILKWSERQKQLERCGLKRDGNWKICVIVLIMSMEVSRHDTLLCTVVKNIL